MTQSSSIQKGTAEGRAMADAVAAAWERSDAPGLTLIKDSKARVYRFVGEGATCYLKVYIPHTLRDHAALWLRPPARLFRSAELLRARGVPGPIPLAAMTLTVAGRKRGAFLMSAVEGIPLKDLAAQNCVRTAVSPGTALGVINATATLWGQLIRNGFVHMDPVKGNFLVDLSGPTPTVAVIDVDNIRRPPWLPRTIRRRRLLKMARRHLGAALRLLDRTCLPSAVARQFVRAYARAAGQPLHLAWQDWRWVGRRLAHDSSRAARQLERVPLTGDSSPSS